MNACLDISNESPSFGEKIKIDASCSHKAEGYFFYVDGVEIDNGSSSTTYICTDSGQHIVKVKARSVWLRESELSKTINVSGKPYATSNSPLYCDQTLHLATTLVTGATYTWNGPNGFISYSANPEIIHAQSNASGTYSVSATIKGKTSAIKTLNVDVLPVFPPCNPANNQCSFTGGLSTTTISYAVTSTVNDSFVFNAGSVSLDLYFQFAGINAPPSGLYTISGNISDLAPNEVFLRITPTGFLENPIVQSGKVYITNNNGKLSAAFCSIPFTYLQYDFTITGNIIQP